MQRHAVLYDQFEALSMGNVTYTPLNGTLFLRKLVFFPEIFLCTLTSNRWNIHNVELAYDNLKSKVSNYDPTETSTPGKIHVCNSPLSEEGVLGFEYGYSLQRCHTISLVIFAYFDKFILLKPNVAYNLGSAIW